MQLIPLEEVEKMIMNANIWWLARASLFAEKTNLKTIDPIAEIDKMIEELYGKKDCETCRQHQSKLCVEHQEVELYLEKLKSRLTSK